MPRHVQTSSPLSPSPHHHMHMCAPHFLASPVTSSSQIPSYKTLELLWGQDFPVPTHFSRHIPVSSPPLSKSSWTGLLTTQSPGHLRILSLGLERWCLREGWSLDPSTCIISWVSHKQIPALGVPTTFSDLSVHPHTFKCVHTK